MTSIPAPTSPPSLDETFESLYITYYAAIVRHLRGLLRDLDQAEEMAQETFTRAYRAFPKLYATANAHANVRAWLYRIATHVAYDVLRRRRRLTWSSLDTDDLVSHLYCDDAAQDDPQHVYDGSHEAVRLALTCMTPRHQRAIVLGFLYDYSNEQLATAFGLRNAKMLRMRARKEFRQCYIEAQRLLDEEYGYDDAL